MSKSLLDEYVAVDMTMIKDLLAIPMLRTSKFTDIDNQTRCQCYINIVTV